MSKSRKVQSIVDLANQLGKDAGDYPEVIHNVPYGKFQDKPRENAVQSPIEGKEQYGSKSVQSIIDLASSQKARPENYNPKPQSVKFHTGTGMSDTYDNSKVPDNYYVPPKLDKDENWGRYIELAQKDTLSDEEKMEAKLAAKLLQKKAKELRGTWNTGSEQEKTLANNYYAISSLLSSKSNAGSAFLAGFADSIPFAKRGIDALSKLIYNNDKIDVNKELGYSEDVIHAMSGFQNKPIESMEGSSETGKNIGNIAGGLISLTAGSGAVKAGTGAIKGFAKLAPWVQSAVNTGLSFGTVSGLSAAGNVPTKAEWDETEQIKSQIAAANGQSYTPQEYSALKQFENVIKSAGISAAGGAAGGLAGTFVGSLGAKVLTKYGLQTPLAEFARQTLSGTAFGATNVGVTYALYPNEYKPSSEQMIKDVSVAFLFSALTSAISTAQITAANKSYIDAGVREMQNEYQRTFSNNVSAEERQLAYNHILEYNGACRKALSQNYLAGQQKYVNNIYEVLDALDEQIGLIKQSTSISSPTMISGGVSIPPQAETGITTIQENQPQAATPLPPAVVPPINTPATITPTENTTVPVTPQAVPPVISNAPSNETIATNKDFIVSAASSLGSKGAKALTSVYDGEGDPEVFYSDFVRYYNAGNSGKPIESVSSNSLTAAQGFAAFSAGQNDAKPAALPSSKTGLNIDGNGTTIKSEAGVLDETATSTAAPIMSGNEKKLMRKWAENEWVNIDLETETPRATAFIKFCDKWFSAGHEGIPTIDVPLEDGIDTEFPAFLQETFYRAGNAEASKSKKSETAIANEGYGSQTLANVLSDKIKKGAEFNSAVLFDAADAAFGGTMAQGKYTPKDAYDALELAVNQHLLNYAKDFNGDSKAAVNAVQSLQKMLNGIPTQTKRTEEQISFQQFSTPPTIAYLAAWAANISNKDIVLEPSAGIGGLAVFPKAWGADVYVNELSERRLSVLKSLGFKETFNLNAEQLNNLLPDGIKPSVVVMNPPFSSTAGRTATNKTANATRHVEQALLRLNDNGRLVVILGKGMANDAPAFKAWWDELRKTYDIRANLSLDGSNYKKYGTTFGVQLVVIDKTGPQSGKTITGEYKDLTEIPKVLEDIRNDRTRTDGSPASNSGSGVLLPTAGDGNSRPRGLQRTDGDVAGNRPETTVSGGNGGRRTLQPSGNRGTISTDGNSKIGAELGDGSGAVSGNVRLQPEQQRPDRPVTERPLSIKPKQAKSDNGVFADYEAPELPISNTVKHPAHLVESAAMAAVSMPKASYAPNLPVELIKSGALSDVQLTNIVYAGQAHECILPDGATRKGYFIGDGTGVGKGRQIAGIILDNIRQGRSKAVWISKSSNLFVDAQRDWADLGGKKDDIFSLSKMKLGTKIGNDSGILFSSYDTLSSEKENNSRLNQLVEWLGKDFDGVIAFDEAHNMGNLLGKKGSRGKTKPSAKALAGAELQKRLPNARVVYCSATAATDVNELAFAQRLGLWGRGTQFNDVNDFVAQIGSGGLAAMELVARDMKSLGVYQARSISFDGVKYDTIKHDLSPLQTEIYNTMCQAWQVTLNNIYGALDASNGAKNPKAKSSALSAYYGAMQRFYNQILTSMSMPSVIEDMKNELANGNSCVLQIVNTNQAESDRQIARSKEEGTALEDLDLTPKGTLLEYLRNSFPIYAYEEYTDDNGNERSRIVTDMEGKPVVDKQALAMREELISRVDDMSVPEGPLELLFDAFGTEQVAEVTGRTRRVIPKSDANGEIKLVEEKRSAAHTAADVQAFQDGKKHILIFSDAGGTGKSYHADIRAKNQEKRIHYLVQPGWSAPKAVQGFGRTNRSNQADVPTYKLVTTNIMGQKRFVSTIARRLDQLGALTKGQRETGSGMFGAKDNLESDLARDSLRNFYDNLGHDRIPDIDGMSILKKLGLESKFLDEYGGFKLNEEVSRDMNTFLNRILALEVDEQNAVFNEFNRIFETNYDAALESGSLDMGLENVKADKIEIIDDKVIRTDENTGATTNYVQAKTFRKPILLKSIKDIENYRSDFRGLYRTDKGDVRAVYRIADKTDTRGNVNKMFRLQSSVTSKSTVWSEETLEKHSSKIGKEQWTSAWDEELATAPKYVENTLHMLTGTLLPIWSRLPKDGNTRVMRIIADDGAQYLGRVIPPSQIDGVLKTMGVGARTKQTYTPAALAKLILNDGAKVALTDNRAILSRRRVSGEYRMELSGSNLWYIAQQYTGVIVETINYEKRYFIPTGEVGETLLAQLIKDSPVSNVSTEGTEDADSLIISDIRSQSVGSGDTSINKEKLPAVFSRVSWEPGTINLDLGGGKFDNATEYLSALGVTNYVYDKYNRSEEHNARAASATQEGQSDTVTVSNVLNVIKEKSGRDEVLLNALDAVKADGTVYITVYEGNGKGEGKFSQFDTVKNEDGTFIKVPKSWQENRLTSSYLPEVRKYFSDVSIRNKVIIAKNPNKEKLAAEKSIEYTKSTNQSDKWNADRVGDAEKKPMPLSDIISKIRYDFGIPVTTGHIRGGKTLGEYRRSSQGIRTKIANDLPTVAHELGHHLDNKFNIVAGMSYALKGELLGALSEEMKQLYSEKKWKTEAFAEYVRKYLQNREIAAVDYPEFTNYFISSMSEEDGKLVLQLADEVNAYYALDAETATSSISLGEKGGRDFRTIGEKIRDKSDVLYQAWIDSNHGIRLFDKVTGANTYKLASNSAYSDDVAGSIITKFLTDMNGRRISGGLLSALADIDLKNKVEYREFGEYLVVKHGPERLKEGMRIFADDRKNSTLWMNSRQAELERKFPKFKEASQRLYEFQKAFLQAWGVDTGLVSAESAEQWAERWKFYVPLNRAVGDKGRMGARRGFANQNSTINKAIGSGLDIVHPVYNIVNNIIRMVNAGTRNNVMAAITTEAKKNDGMALFLEKVPAPIKVTNFDARELKKGLSEKAINASLSNESQNAGLDAVSGINAAFDIISSIDDILVQYGRGKASGDVITVLRRGKPEFWKINDPLLLSSVTNMNVKRMPAWLEVYGDMSRFMTSNITGNNVLWSIFSNSPRDLMTLFTFSKDKNPLHLLGGIGSAYVNKIMGNKADPLYLEYLAMGGGNTSVYTSDKDLAKKIRKKVTGDKLSWLNPMEWLEFVADTVELGPRFAYYKIMREKGLDTQDAFFESTDITVNFRRGGINARTLNKVIPFFNAGIQGLDKFARWITAEEAPVGARTKAVRGRIIAFVASSAALAALVLALNVQDEQHKKDYMQLSNYTKNSFWCIPIGDGKFITIPKPREIAVLTSLMETIVERYYMGNSHAFDGFYEYFAQQALPNVVSDIAQGDIYGAIGSLGVVGVGSYMMANRDFLGNPIVSSGLQALEPKDQYTNRTSKIAKAVGQAFNQSPQMIDYFFQQTLGGWWKTQKALFPVGGENVDYTLGIQGQYVRDNQFSTDIVNWLYDKSEKTQAEKNSNPEDINAAIENKWDSLMTTFYSRFYKLAKGKPETVGQRATRQTVLNMILEYRKNCDNGTKTSAQKAVEDVCCSVGSTDNMPAVMQSVIKDDDKKSYSLDGSQYVEYQTEYLTAYYDYVEGTLPLCDDDNSKDAALKAAKEKAKDDATARALNRLGVNNKIYEENQEAEAAGIDPTESILFKAALDVGNDDGSLKQDEIIAILQGMALSDPERSYLFHTRYESKKNNPFD
ncbi:MAG: strawberry notch family protein [Oscillospiraceae bacterium]